MSDAQSLAKWLIGGAAPVWGGVGQAMPEAQQTYAADPLARAIMSAGASMATLPRRAMEASETMRGTGVYDPGPMLEAAMLPMGTGAIAGVPMRAGEAVLGAGPVRAQYGVGDPTQTGWVFKDVAHPNMSRADNRVRSYATDTGEGISQVELPIRSLNATQKSVNPDFANVQPRGDGKDLPFVVKKDGQYYVQDGHHRLTKLSEEGKSTAQVRMLDLDGTTQTQFPLVDLMQGPQGIRAYHGSPHDFERFSLDKIGTGEGAQAYGHGLYFAEREGTAKAYRDALGDAASTKIDGIPVSELASQGYKAGAKVTPEMQIADYVASYGTLQNARHTIANRRPELLPVFDELEKSGRLSPGGKMYEVNINADPAHFLDWDKPLSQQPQHVQDAFARLGVQTEDKSPYWMNSASNELAKKTGEWEGAAGAGNLSKALAKEGIPGIKYLDQFSRSAGEGSRNYVVFDDKLIDILKKYGLAGILPGAGLLAAPPDYIGGGN